MAHLIVTEGLLESLPRFHCLILGENREIQYLILSLLNVHLFLLLLRLYSLVVNLWLPDVFGQVYLHLHLCFGL